MHLTRRTMISGLVATAAASALPRPLHAQTEAAETLTARAATARIAPADYPDTAVWSYNGAVPGAPIRLRQGERLRRLFRNDLDQPGTVHWHGIRIDNAMDGVPGLTQSVVAPGDSYLYDFELPDAGTYWFHPHNRAWEQMARGLSGALIVEETNGAPEVDLDEVLLIDDWRLSEDGQIAGGFNDMHDWAHAGRIGNWVTVNGTGGWRRMVARNARVRLRLINAANARIFNVAAQGLEGWIVALDGMPLDAPRRFDQLTLAPAQRADLIVDVTANIAEKAYLVGLEGNSGYALATFDVDGEAHAERLPAPNALPANPVSALGAVNEARRIELRMEGGAMGSMRGATMSGRMMGMSELVNAGKVWAFNGMADMPDNPLFEARAGETVKVAIVNDTAWPHAMHLHGHHFRQVLRDGTTGPLRDTLLMDRDESVEIAFVADNPGDWLLHCHMLEHSASGMMTWLRVT